jgi:hypothetical protein
MIEISYAKGYIQVVEGTKVHASFSYANNTLSKAQAAIKAQAFKDGMMYVLKSQYKGV